MIDVHPMRDGFALRLDLGDPLQRAMAVQRRYESDVTWVYPYLLRPGDRVIDGGARIDYIVCELNTFLADAQGESYDATRAFCERYGYTAYDLRRTARLQRIERPIVETGHLVTDLLFVSPRRTSLDA